VKVVCRGGIGSQEAPSNIDDMHRMNGGVYSRPLTYFRNATIGIRHDSLHALASGPSERLTQPTATFRELK